MPDKAPPVREQVLRFVREGDIKQVNSLPGNLFEAVGLTEKSALVREALGEHVFRSFVHNKKIEWDRYRTQVSAYEVRCYLPMNS